MRCPHCEKEIDHVITASYYYQIQRLDVKGNLIQEYEDMNDAIGDTMFTDCPECDNEINFDNSGRLVSGKQIVTYEEFEVGDIVNVKPSEFDDFNEFTGRIDKIYEMNEEIVTVIDQDDNAFNVWKFQITKE